MNPELEETIYCDFITSSPTTGAAADADSTPTCEVFEDATDTAILSPTVVKRTGKTGNYRVPVVCSAANGFEAAKSYNVVVAATVGAVAAKAVVQTFQVRTNGADDLAASILTRATPANVATELANVGLTTTVTGRIDAAISTRSTYAGTDTSGTTTLLSRVPTTVSSQASNDQIYAAIDTEVGAIKAVTDKLDTTLELDGAVYRYTTNALEQAPTGGGGGQYAQSGYRSDTATTAASDPGTGDVRWNNATQSLATALYFDDITSNGGDASNVFASIVPGDILTLQQKDSAANVQHWIITSALDNIGWWTFNITPSLFEGTNIGNNQDVIVRIAHPATTLEEIADAILKRDFSAISGEAAYSLLNAARMLRNVWSTAGGTLTVKKEDGTTAWTRTLSTDPTAAPITGAS